MRFYTTRSTPRPRPGYLQGRQSRGKHPDIRHLSRVPCRLVPPQHYACSPVISRTAHLLWFRDDRAVQAQSKYRRAACRSCGAQAVQHARKRRVGCGGRQAGERVVRGALEQFWLPVDVEGVVGTIKRLAPFS